MKLGYYNIEMNRTITCLLFLTSFIIVVALMHYKDVKIDLLRCMEPRPAGRDQQDFTEQRNHFLNNQQSRKVDNDKQTDLKTIYFLVVPEIDCPTAVRLGNSADGGKWVCNPWRAPEGCTVLTFGINSEVSFETALYEATKKKCRIHCFDIKDEKKELFLPFNGVFSQKRISAKTNEAAMELSVLDSAKNIGATRIDFMKMDIEGGEYSALKEFLSSNFLLNGSVVVCQLFLELHGNVPEWKNLQKQISQNKFRMFYKEANYFCADCHEFSFIHESCLIQYGLDNRVFNENF